MASTTAHRIDRRPAIERAVHLDVALGTWSCRSIAATGTQMTFGPMPTAHANRVKYGRPRRKWM